MGDTRAFELASMQNGVVATWQLRDAGLTRQQVWRMGQSPLWVSTDRTVLRNVAVPDGKAQRVTSEVLAVGRGAFLSHASAAAWWGHPGCRLLDPVQVTTRMGHRVPTGTAQVFHMREPDRRWTTSHRGVAVARPELVAMQLFAVLGYQRAARIVDRLWSMNLVAGHSIALLLKEMGRRGRNGTAGLREFLDARGLEYRPPDSGLESRVEEILRRAGIEVRRQVDLGGERDWSGRVDFLHSTLPLVIEVQSEMFHSSLSDAEADLRRIENLRADGFGVVEVTDKQVWTAPHTVVGAVRAEISAKRLHSRDGGR